MEISFGGQYDKALFYKAVLLANQPPRQRRIINNLMVIFMLAAGVVLVVRLVESRDVFENAPLITVLMIVAAFSLRSLLQPRLTARSLWANPGVRRKINGTISNRGITYILPNGNNQILWENINRIKKKPDLVTMITINGLLLIFPQWFFKNISDWNRFYSLIEKKVVSIK